MKVRSIAIILTLAMVFSWVGVPAAHAEEIPDVTQYSYTVTPILASFTYYLYVKTDNPDPTSFRLVDPESKFFTADDYGEIHLRTEDGLYFNEVDPGTYYISQNLYEDVVYEDESIYRVSGGYIFKAEISYSDGGEFILMQKTQSGRNILYDTFIPTEVSVPCQPLNTCVGYLIDTCTNDEMLFFEKLDAVQAYLDDFAVYPRNIYDMNSPNKERPYPFLARSIYPELSFNEEYKMYNYLDAGLLLSAVYPFVLDSLGVPGTIWSVAEQLEPDCEITWGTYHYLIHVTYENETRDYGGAGSGGNDPLFSNRVKKVFTFQGGEDFGSNGTIEAYNSVLRSYEPVAAEDIQEYRNMIKGTAFHEAIRATGGTWIKVATEGFFGFGTSFGYAVPLGSRTMFVSNAWVDGRYIGARELITYNKKFEDYPTDSIVLHDVTYTDYYGKTHTQDVVYDYDAELDAWTAPYFYGDDFWYSLSWKIPDELILTREQVEAMVLDGNSCRWPESGLVYDGTVYPGTPCTQTLVTGVSITDIPEIHVGQQIEINAVVEPSDAMDTSVSWTSSNPSVAEIPNPDFGLINGISEGNAVLTVITTDGRYSASCTVTVLPELDPCANGHSFTNYISNRDATHSEDGTKTAQCDNECGATDTIVDEGSAYGHTFSDRYVIAPTCTEQGYTIHMCYCGEQYEDSYVDALGHTEIIDIAVAPTCEKTGLTEGAHCSVCNIVLIKQRTVPVAPCDWDEGTVTKEPTEDTEGAITYRCKNCKVYMTVSIPVLEHTHKYASVVTVATCTEQGYTTYTCTCGHSYVDNYVNTKGHVEEILPAEEPSCTEDGLTEGKRCSVCAEIFTPQEAVPATGHSWDTGTVTKEPSENSEGVMTYKCTVCSESKTENIPVLEHIHKHDAKVTEPTCTEKGYTTYTCACGDRYVENYVNAKGHAEVVDSAVAATCEAAGLTEGKHCSVCGEVITKQETIPAIGHSWSEGSCTVCGEEDPIYVQPTVPDESTEPEEPTEPEETTEPEDTTDISRLAGDNRFNTAFLVADQMKVNLGIDKFDAIIVASGTNFADALSGSYLAAVKNAPILLSFNDKYNELAKDYIWDNLTPGGTVYILGGTAAVPASMEAGLDNFNIVRLAGSDRFGTNLAILKEAGVADKDILICTGLSFADSLSASASELPILLVWNKLTEDQKTFLDSLNSNKLYIIGGESAVSKDMEKKVAAYGETERVGGANRFETSVNIAGKFFENPDSAVLAYAWNYPDGLCGGALAATMDAPLILTMDNYEARAAEYIQDKAIK